MGMHERSSVGALMRVAVAGLSLGALTSQDARAQGPSPGEDIARIAQSSQTVVLPAGQIPGEYGPAGTPIPQAPGPEGAPPGAPSTGPAAASPYGPGGSAFQPMFSPEQFAAGRGATFA